ncbi:hypothetical protein OV207_18020 [Corallococcus sp. BB11-1]|uniref:hypothetical protein n=1 Tax=Corallococcus sp. BB11-1 TaxID=2996783 RepID=UPI0010F1E840|nr:hypothetical protein [Corallococcus sp. BB11-1]MCY1033356.1 hypothetical protein [Corallococcus sp. BB11-1]RYZ45676.1 MAG: hypothetical protein EOO72_03685 [Myxococcaceae bacterium]
MEIYRNPQSKKQAEQPHAVYYSRLKLIAGALLWSLALAFFGALTYRSLGETGAMAFFAVITAGAGWMLITCVRCLTRLDTPALFIGRDGIRFADGVLIAWDEMKENVYVDQSYMGIPILKLVQVKTTLAKPKVKKQRVAALAMDSDEYLALCDNYSQGVMPVTTR